MERVPRKQKRQETKRSRVLAGALLLLAVLGAVVFFVQKQEPLPEPEGAEKVYLVQMAEEEMTALQVMPRGKAPIHLVKTEDGMRLKGREEIALRESIVSDMLYAAGNIQAYVEIGPMEELEEGPGVFGLEEPALRLIITGAEGTEQQILFGDEVPQAETEQYFALTEGVLYAVLAEPCDILFHDAQYLRAFDQPKFQADLLDRIEVSGKEELAFAYTPDGFVMEVPYAYPAMKTKMDALLKRIEAMAFEAYLGTAAENDLESLGLSTPETIITLTQAPSVIQGTTLEGESVTMHVEEVQHQLHVSRDMGESVQYVLWNGGVYKASSFLFGFWQELQAEEFLSHTPMNFLVDRLNTLEITGPQGDAAYEVEMVEAVGDDNRIMTDEYGQTLYDAAVKKNGEAMDAQIFLNWYVQLNRLPLAGRVQEGQSWQETPEYTLSFKTDAVERTVTFHEMDALHLVMMVDGVAPFYVEKDALSLLETLP